LLVPLTNRSKLVNYIHETHKFPRGVIKIIEIESGIAKGGQKPTKKAIKQ